jgi:demethylmenaquinone methyltransferase/2-methoxy-6-polyprenyl-1,4-benzoquinol methylase
MNCMEAPRNLVPKFFDNTARTYDRVASWATYGKDDYWKNTILSYMVEGDSILDLACGTGILTRKIAQKFPNSKIIGVDITQSYLEVAKRNSSRFQNITFVNQDAEKLDLDTKFDCITSSYIPKYCNPTILIPLCIKHLKVGGRIILHDFTYPKNTLVRFLWHVHFGLLRLAGNFLPEWKGAFFELPDLIKSTTWVTTYQDEMKKGGLDVQCQHLTWNSSAILIGIKNT